VRASMGALFTVPVVRCDFDAFHAWLRDGPGQLIGLSLDTDIDYRADIPADRQRSPRHARRNGQRVRPARKNSDARQGGQPQRRGRDRSDGI